MPAQQEVSGQIVQNHDMGQVSAMWYFWTISTRLQQAQ
jgi:hypothetical protein